MAKSFKIAGVQMDVREGKPQQNLAAMLALFEETAANGARLTVFPECALPGYCFNSLEEAEPFFETIPGPSTDKATQACKEHNAYMAFGLLEKDGGKHFNTSVLLGPEGIVGKYRKVHLPFLGVDRFITHGTEVPAVYNVEGVKVGMLICYDTTFPEAARILALKGADIIILPTNWPQGAERIPGFIVNARALENRVYFLAVNRIGECGKIRFIGKSKFCDTMGNNIVEIDHNDHVIVYGEVDPELARNKRIIRIPGECELDYIADRRPEMYGDITKTKRKE